MFGYNFSKGAVVALWLAALAAPALAIKNVDLQACRYTTTGLVIPAVECEAMRKYQAKEDQEQAARAEQQAKFKAQMEADERERAERYMADDVRAAKMKAEYEATRARDLKQLADYRAANDREAARYAAQQAAQAKAAASVRQQCGADHGVVKVGMPFARVKQCAGPFRVTAEVNRRDGVLTTYQGQGKYVHVMEGQVVGWGQY